MMESKIIEPIGPMTDEEIVAFALANVPPGEDIEAVITALKNGPAVQAAMEDPYWRDLATQDAYRFRQASGG